MLPYESQAQGFILSYGDFLGGEKGRSENYNMVQQQQQHLLLLLLHQFVNKRTAPFLN